MRSDAAEHFCSLVGGDIPFLPELEDQRVVDSDDRDERDLLQSPSHHGFNAIRLKLWHTPEAPYNTLEQVLALTRRIEDAGRVFRSACCRTACTRIPRASVKTLADQGTPPEIAQIGTETRPGMLWPEGRVDGEYDIPAQWDRLVMLLEAGIRGARDGSPRAPPSVMLHFDNVAKNELRFNLPYPSARYDKDGYVVETSYPWTMEWRDEAPNIMGSEEDLHEGFPPTVEGQAAFLRAAREVVEGVPEGRGRGVIYRAPERIAVEGVDSHWESAALFDFEGKSLPGLDALTDEALAR